MDIKKVSAAQTTNKIAFKARFFKDDIKTLIKEATPKSAFDSKDPRVEIPKLYTALKFLDENHPDKMLKLNTDTQLYREKKAALSHGESYSHATFTKIFNENGKKLVDEEKPLYALYGLCLKSLHATHDKRYLRMPQSVFENEWWKNRNVTIEDVEKLAFDYNA